jgi:FAD/FMN-containing dehydrogenase
MSQREPTWFQDLEPHFEGDLYLPRDPGYDDARTIWNGMFDRKPAAIARCARVEDVILAVNCARDNGLVLSVRGGGHGAAGNAVVDAGLMIDLSRMNLVVCDPKTRTATAEGGALLADLDAETQRHGLAVSAGVISHTGVGGLTLGGGFGWLSRRYGLSVDNLVSVQMVAADGKRVTASETENPDLFWGLRGGGGNFGVATSFQYRCAEIGPEVYAGLLVRSAADARAAMRFQRDYVRELPDGMTVWMAVRLAPPLPFLPPEIHGKLVFIAPFVWLGDPQEGERLLKPLRDAAPLAGEMTGMHPWTAWQSSLDPLAAHGARNYWKSHHLKDLSDPCIDRILDFMEKAPSPECEVFIPHMEGAASRVPEDATAYAHRKPPFTLNVHTRWQKAADDPKCMTWAKDFHAATEEFAQGVYVNFLSQEGEERVREAYTPAAWKRLVEVKNRWDPKNLFRMNQNIRPSV